MKRRLSILCALVALFLCSCAKEDNVLPAQQEQIRKYLQSTHQPNLITEAQRDPDRNQPFYTPLGDLVCRYITEASYYNPDRVNKPEVTASSKVTITFSAYVFKNQNITDKTLPFFSNDPYWKKMLTDPSTGLPIVLWPFEPLVIDMHDGGGIINGLYLALLGCRQDDQVEAYMSYNMAYGDENFSVIPKQSAIAYFFTIDKVE